VLLFPPWRTIWKDCGKKTLIHPPKKAEKEHMGEANDPYALTLYDKDDKYKHIYFRVRLCTKNNPHGFDVLAMVDTGATISGITKRMIEEMGLESGINDDFLAANGKHTSPIYIFDVIFPRDKLLKNIEAVQISDEHNCDFLIGMNILRRGDTAITYASGKMMFSFRMPPAEKHIDYEYELLKAKYPDQDIKMLYP
jgi:predicted aspartyl protease